MIHAFGFPGSLIVLRVFGIILPIESAFVHELVLCSNIEPIGTIILELCRTCAIETISGDQRPKLGLDVHIRWRIFVKRDTML